MSTALFGLRSVPSVPEAKFRFLSSGYGFAGRDIDGTNGTELTYDRGRPRPGVIGRALGGGDNLPRARTPRAESGWQE